MLEWFGLLHPLVVHFPIALLSVLALSECFRFSQPSTPRRDHRYGGLIIVVLSSLASIAFGLINATHSAGQHEAELLDDHRIAGYAAGLLSCIALFLLGRAIAGAPVIYLRLYQVVLFCAVLVVSICGHLGGELVYGKGYLWPSATSELEIQEQAPLVQDLGIQVSYKRDIQPILANRCYKCHGSKKQKGDLRLDQRATAFLGGESGPTTIVPYNPQMSLLYTLCADPEFPDEIMPPKGDPLTVEQCELIKMWIAQGAAWPSEE